jgi:hypothetical protein
MESYLYEGALNVRLARSFIRVVADDLSISSEQVSVNILTLLCERGSEGPVYEMLLDNLRRFFFRQGLHYCASQDDVATTRTS